MSFTQRTSFLVIMAIMLLTAHGVSASNSRPPRNNDISNMADALKYLQDLDTYYADRARARFGKRAPLVQLLRQHLLDNPELAHPADIKAMDEIY